MEKLCDEHQCWKVADITEILRELIASQEEVELCIAEKLNFFPPVNGSSAYYSPREIMSQQRLDYFKNCIVSQFSYVQAHDDPKLKNTQQARTIDCI